MLLPSCMPHLLEEPYTMLLPSCMPHLLEEPYTMLLPSCMTHLLEERPHNEEEEGHEDDAGECQGQDVHVEHVVVHAVHKQEVHTDHLVEPFTSMRMDVPEVSARYEAGGGG